MFAFEVVLLAIGFQPNDENVVVHGLDVPEAALELVTDNEDFPA